MASTLESTNSRYLDFDEYIDFQLARTGSGIRAVDLLTAAGVAATTLCGYVLAFVVFDHWVIPGGFPEWARVTMLVATFAALTAWIGWKLVLPYFRRVSRLYAARTIERSAPELKSGLLNLIDLKRAGRPVPEDIRLAMERQAAVAMTRADVDHAVDHRPLVRTILIFLAIAFVGVLYAVLSPKDIGASIRRALFPAAAVEAPTRTEIVKVEPGNREVLMGSQLEVLAEIRGQKPEAVRLIFTTDDREFVDAPLTMRDVDEGGRRFRTILTGASGTGLGQSLTYHVVAGDDRSPDYRITVIRPPTATVRTLHYEYPPYMQLAPRDSEGGNLSGWEGTRVTIHARAESASPIKTARVMFSNDETGPAVDEVPMSIRGDALEATWELAFDRAGTYPGFYRIELRDAENRVDPSPPVYTVQILPDRVPQVKVLDPTGDLERPANAVVPVLFDARDDFQLTAIRLRMRKNGEELPQSLDVFRGERSALADQYLWELEPFTFQPGDVVTWWLEARDNREPNANIGRSREREIRIVEPAAEDEIQEQLEADRRRQEEVARQQFQQDPVDSPTNQADRPDARQPDTGDPQGENPPPDAGNPPPEAGNPPQDANRPMPQDGQPNEAEPEPREGGGAEQPMPGGAGQQQAPGAGETRQPGDAGQPNDGGQQGGSERSGETGAGQRSPGGNNAGAPKQPLDDSGMDDGQALREFLRKIDQERRENGGQPENPTQQPPQTDAANDSPREPSPGEQPGEQPMDGSSPDGSGEQPNGTSSERGTTDPSTPASQDRNGNSGTKPSPNNATPPSDAATPDGQPREDASKPMGDAEKPSGADGGEQPGEKPQPMGKQPDGGTGKPDADSPRDGGADRGTSDGAGEGGKPASNNQPAGGGDNAEPRGAGGRKPERPIENRRTEPADGHAPAERRGTGEERGVGEPETDPNAQPKSAKHNLERKQGTDPVTKPRPEQPGDTPQSRDPRPGSRNPGEAQPTPMTKPGGEGTRPNPEQRPGQSDGPMGHQPAGRTDGQPDVGEDELKGPGRPEGQRSENPAGGEGGSSKQNTQGTPGGNQEGPGDSTGKPGDNEAAEKPAGGRPGEQQGEGSTARPTDQQQDGPGDGQREDTQAERGGRRGSKSADPSEAQEENADPNGDAEGLGQRTPGDRTPSGGGGLRGGAPGPGQRDEPFDPGEMTPEEVEQARLEHGREAANMVLRRLQDELNRGEIDEDWLKKTGWTEEQARRFAERLEENLQQSGDAATAEELARQRQFEEFLKGLTPQSTGRVRKGADVEKRDQKTVFGSQRQYIPPEYREIAEQYKRGISRRTTAP
ncbi:MAG: hypothetical protein KY476_02665 [Planctomycetes bacterium]|nr:hypothetical protein [Planctomycetota bacterium]